MKNQYDLSQLDWQLSGWMPFFWQFGSSMEVGAKPDAQVVLSAKVPGSVQNALREADMLPDWNVGLNAQLCEWVENRHWVYEAMIPDDWIQSESQLTYRLNCLGLDYCGWIYLNSKVVGEFRGTHIPHTFDITPHLTEKQNVLRIIFDLPPRWLGQCGFSSKMKEWKTRFNYTWDWQPRLVQVGIWDSVFIKAVDGQEIESFCCIADADVDTETGKLRVNGKISTVNNSILSLSKDAPLDDGAVVRLSLGQEDNIVYEETILASEFNLSGINWKNLPVDLWWPNLQGDQPLYLVTCALIGKDGKVLDETSRRVGFRNISWIPCEGAPENAEPWVCVVNGHPTFLQGVNFPPVLPNYADVTKEDYRKRLELYKELGVNILRINACGFLEKQDFYDLCDELGLMVWQEFPLTSSGIENIPPADADSINAMAQIAKSFIGRRQHHASLILWSGGNELMDLEGHPLDASHPMLGRLQEVVREHDPTRRFIAASPNGPRFGANAAEFGQGLHWDVHGPWKLDSDMKSWVEYFSSDDALFRSELGSPGASPVEIIRRYRGSLDELPINVSNPLWHNPVSWWLEDKQFIAECGREPESLEEYVSWSQNRQAEALSIAVKACKDRFPYCGGAILWTGHDCFPCPTNTSIVDFNGNPKPAALALAKIWKSKLYRRSDS